MTVPALGLARPELQLSALLAVAVVFGGGGVGAALPNLVVQLLALAIMAFNARAVGKFITGGPIALRLLVAGSVLVPLFQLIPLPPGLWQVMPGRDLVSQSLALVGPETEWRPLSVFPARTLLAATGLIAPLAVLVLGARLDRGGRNFVLGTIAGLGLFNLMIGAIQLVSGNQLAHFHGGTIDASQLYGTFANHNTAGIFFVIALFATLGLKADQNVGSHFELLRWTCVGLFALSVVLTQSRSSLLVLVLAGLALGLVQGMRHLRRMRAAPRTGRRSRHRSWWRRRPVVTGLIAAAFIVLGIAAFVASSGKIGQTAERFSFIEDDVRPRIWSDALISVDRFWPLGSGMGTFDEVFQLDESLENLEPGRAGRAHNEYLEVPIEAGAIGVGLIAAWAVWLGILCIRTLRGTQGLAEVAVPTALAVIALQSAVDYPLRSQAGLCLAAALIAVLVRQLASRNAAERTAE